MLNSILHDLLKQMMPLYLGCVADPTHCNCRIYPEKARTDSHWEHCMVLIPMSERYFCGARSQWVTEIQITCFSFSFSIK